MKKLLLVSYYFPPLGGSGVFRPIRLTKYLPRFGWNVTVLTVNSGVRALKDDSLLAEVRPEVEVCRSRSIEPRTVFLALNRLGLGGLVRRLEPWFMLPDDQVGWVPFARRLGARILSGSRFSALITTAGPYSSHLIGQDLKHRTGIPWVADFRDEWTTNPYLENRYPTRWHRSWNRSLEEKVLRGADRVVSVSRPWLDALRGIVPDLPPDKFMVQPNGFDAEHFPSRSLSRPERFRVVYTGSFYGHRSPRTFLEAARRCLADGRIAAEDLEIVLMGHGGIAMNDVGRSELPPHVVRVVGHRPYFSALELLREAAALLLVVPREGGAGNHTGKLFPYLASGRPILVLAPRPNVAADLVLRARSGVVAAPDDPDSVATALVRLYQAWKGIAPLATPDPSAIEPYEAVAQARQWAEMLDEMVERRIATSCRPTTSSE